MANSDDERDMHFSGVELFLKVAEQLRPDTIDGVTVKQMKLISVDVPQDQPNTAKTVIEFTPNHFLTNFNETLHGGIVATVFDICTSSTLHPLAKDGFWENHVSRTLSTTYLRPVAVGEVLLVESEVVHLGRTMAMLKGVMKRKSDGKVCYTCEHNKVNVVSKAAL